MVVTIIGPGLIGGSIALSLKNKGLAQKIIGVDKSAENAQMAKALGIIDEVKELTEAVLISDMVIVAVPVDATVQLLPFILDLVGPTTGVMDVGSTKSYILEKIKDHPKRKHFVATHPMSGTENSGPSAAFDGLFKDKVAIICDKESSSDWVVARAESIYVAMESRLIYMNAAEHDEHVGYVSHLSHVISYALAAAVLDKEKSTSTIFDLAAGGFASTARLAKSSSEMWSPIFYQNSDNILSILDIYMAKLQEFSTFLRNQDFEKLTDFIKEANKIRKVLDKRE